MIKHNYAYVCTQECVLVNSETDICHDKSPLITRIFEVCISTNPLVKPPLAPPLEPRAVTQADESGTRVSTG